MPDHEKPDNDWMVSLQDVYARLAGLPPEQQFHYPLRHGSLRLGVYAPRGADTQTLHRQDEVYIVIAGSGDFVKNGQRRRFRAQDAIFVEAGAEHRFENFSADFATWVIFWGPDGGEAQTAAQ